MTAAPRRKPGSGMEDLAERIKNCTLCPLCETRTNTVPGEGNPRPEAAGHHTQSGVARCPGNPSLESGPNVQAEARGRCDRSAKSGMRWSCHQDMWLKRIKNDLHGTRRLRMTNGLGQLPSM